MLLPNLYARVRFSNNNGTRDRGCGEHPVFPAPSSSGGQRNVQTSGERCREIAEACPIHYRLHELTRFLNSAGLGFLV